MASSKSSNAVVRPSAESQNDVDGRCLGSSEWSEHKGPKQAITASSLTWRSRSRADRTENVTSTATDDALENLQGLCYETVALEPQTYELCRLAITQLIEHSVGR